MPNFTKKHYEMIAEIIGESKDMKMLIKNFLFYLELDNENFDRDKFIDAIEKERAKHNF